MRKKIAYFLCFLIGLVLAVGFYVSKYHLPYAIIKPLRITENSIPQDFGLKSIDLEIMVEDSLKLKGYWIKNDSISPRAIIVYAHGIGSCKEHALPLAKNLSKIGVETILMDNRAHGESGGQFCTYGYKEKYDISAIIDFIKKNNDSTSIGIWGHSMGGAIALQTLELDKRIEFGIIESAFADLNQIIYDYQKRMTYGIGLKPACYIALTEAGKIADFDPDAVSPINSVKNIEQPIMLAHGEVDQDIKFTYGQELFDNLKSKEKKFVPVKNAGHLDIPQKGGVAYDKLVKDFIILHSN